MRKMTAPKPKSAKSPRKPKGTAKPRAPHQPPAMPPPGGMMGPPPGIGAGPPPGPPPMPRGRSKMPPPPKAGPGISFQKLPGKKQVLWGEEKLAGAINPDSPDQKKAKLDATFQHMQTVPRDAGGRNKKVGYAPDNSLQRRAGTAGHAIDPISSQPMVKGSPVAAQDMSPAAQFGRRLGMALEPGFERRVSKQKLAGKKSMKKKGK